MTKSFKIEDLGDKVKLQELLRVLERNDSEMANINKIFELIDDKNYKLINYS